MICISLINMKGGVGKTTLAVNLAWNMARRQQKRVLLIDLDPQFNASQYLMTFDKYSVHRAKSGTVADLLLDTKRPRMALKDKVGPEEFNILSLIEREDGKKGYLYLLPSELNLARAVKNPQGVEFRLEKTLKRWDSYFDYAFIDCAPTDTVLTATALMASNYVLVPMKPDRFSILGYGMMKEVLENFKNDYPNPRNVRDLGVVFTLVSGTSNNIEIDCKAQVSAAASYVFNTEISESSSYLRSVHEQSPVFDTRYARALTRSSIDSLVGEIETRINQLNIPPIPRTKPTK